MENILISGGAGFIGSHVIRRFVNQHPVYHIINLDNLTYAGNLENLKDIESKENYEFIKCDITNAKEIEGIFQSRSVHSVIHLAAESHVDRSITNPIDFVMTNVVGTVILLNAFKSYGDTENGRFYHVSTDEVYGTRGEEGKFTESTPYDPNSPYSASKASSDHFVRAYAETYGLPVVISNCSNNYGPYQFPEKLIPLVIYNALAQKAIPIYGDGMQIRDWLYVSDHCSAIRAVLERGECGEVYNIGGLNEKANIEIVHILCDILDELHPLGAFNGISSYRDLITYVKDRPGHDRRYAIDAAKIENELNWRPAETFETGIRKTVEWYLNNADWVEQVISGEYRQWVKRQYS